MQLNASNASTKHSAATLTRLQHQSTLLVFLILEHAALT